MEDFDNCANNGIVMESPVDGVSGGFPTVINMIQGNQISRHLICGAVIPGGHSAWQDKNSIGQVPK